MYRCRKVYGHDLGLSCTFRQWKAKSHCNKLHGYSLKVVLEFEATTLDDTNWVVDFGAMSEVKEWIKSNFDHTTIVALNDPELNTFKNMQLKGIVNLIEIENVGCEAFARYIYDYVSDWVAVQYKSRVYLSKVEVHEHGANSATYAPLT